MINVIELQRAQHNHAFIGRWHIYWMEFWDASYLDMDVQAYLEVRPDNTGTFQFGLVTGYLDGEVEEDDGAVRFVFTWEGQDEMDEASGRGQLRLRENGELVGVIKLHGGDRSKLRARRIG